MTRRERIEYLRGRYAFFHKLGKHKRATQIKVVLDALVEEQLAAENLAATIRRDLELIANVSENGRKVA